MKGVVQKLKFLNNNRLKTTGQEKKPGAGI
jgi:hypothetical protein